MSITHDQWVTNVGKWADKGDMARGTAIQVAIVEGLAHLAVAVGEIWLLLEEQKNTDDVDSSD